MSECVYKIPDEWGQCYYKKFSMSDNIMIEAIPDHSIEVLGFNDLINTVFFKLVPKLTPPETAPAQPDQ